MHFNVCDWHWRKTDENKSGNALPIVAAMFVGTLCVTIGGDTIRCCCDWTSNTEIFIYSMSMGQTTKLSTQNNNDSNSDKLQR